MSTANEAVAHRGGYLHEQEVAALRTTLKRRIRRLTADLESGASGTAGSEANDRHLLRNCQAALEVFEGCRWGAEVTPAPSPEEEDAREFVEMLSRALIAARSGDHEALAAVAAATGSGEDYAPELRQAGTARFGLAPGRRANAAELAEAATLADLGAVR